MSKTDTVFGLHAVESLLQKDAARVKNILVMKGRDDIRLQRIIELAQREGVASSIVARRELDELVRGRHQGIVAVVEPSKELHEHDLEGLLDSLNEKPFLVILDSVTDPHNLGACLRSADAAGAHAVITPKDKSAPLNAVARNVASGAAENIPLVRVTNLARTLRSLQERGIWLVGAAGEGEQELYQADLKGALGIVMGAEGSGLRRLTREHCDQLVRIPMAGSVSSLNVSVATGVFLFEAVRQRQRSGDGV